jgi:hypothetical protein
MDKSNPKPPSLTEEIFAELEAEGSFGEMVSTGTVSLFLCSPSSARGAIPRRSPSNSEGKHNERSRAAPVTAMSRGFVKEAEDKVEELSDRPISGHRNLVVTPEGLAAIEASPGPFRRSPPGSNQ